MTDTDKLTMILEHAEEEYNEEGRLYEFVRGGFMQYELLVKDSVRSIYFIDMFIGKRYRGTKSLLLLINCCKSLVELHDVSIAYCRVERLNPYINVLQKMYARLNFIEFDSDEESIYYKWIKP